MKYLLNINEFFSKRLEESKLSTNDIKTSSDNRYKSVRDFIANTKNETTIWSDVFKGRNRIYFDMNGTEIDKKDLIKNSKNVVLTLNNSSDLNRVEQADMVIYHSQDTIKEIVSKVLIDLGYKYFDYDNNKCSKDDKNYTTISAILSRKNIDEVYKKIDLLNKYNQRNNKNVFNKPIIIKQKETSIDDYMIVFSNHPVDLMTMSSNRPWEQTSCMRISGAHHNFVYADINNGSVVCFQTTIDDFNINSANARILYKPFIDIEDEDIAVLYSPNKVYGNPLFDFYDVSLEIVNNTFNEGIEGNFELHNDLYNDDQSQFINKYGNDITEEGITADNFWEIYTDEDASDELFGNILNECNWIGDDKYEILLPILKRIFEDLNLIGKKIVLYEYLKIIDEVFIDEENDVEDFKENYLDNLIDYFNEIDDDDDRYKYKILISCYEIIGESFVYQHLQDFYDYIFNDLKEHYNKFQKDDNYKKLLTIEALFNNDTIKNEYHRLVELYDSGKGHIKLDADNGEYLSIKKDNRTIDVYKNVIKIENDTLKIFVSIYNSDTRNWDVEDYLTMDEIDKIVRYDEDEDEDEE